LTQLKTVYVTSGAMVLGCGVYFLHYHNDPVGNIVGL